MARGLPKQVTDRAFTLIELLVVIAIIAVLAAILFPVFAQAKVRANATATLSNFKQSATGVLMYMNDNDDCFPQAFSFNHQNNLYRTGFWVPVPAGWQNDGLHNIEPRLSEDGMFWANACLPYTKSADIYEMKGVAATRFTGVRYDQTLKQPASVGIGFNGLLHTLGSSEVAMPSKLTLLWPGVLKQNVYGFGFTNPHLACDLAEPCRFSPNGAPQPDGDPYYGYVWHMFGDNIDTQTTYIYGESMHIAAVDGHAYSLKMQTPSWPKISSDVNTRPFSSYDTAFKPGTPYWITDCVAPGGEVYASTFYPGFFRPDSQFTYSTKECDFGQDAGGSF